MQSDVLIGTLVGLVAGFLLGAFAALRFDDWLKNKPRRIRCDLGAPVEPRTQEEIDAFGKRLDETCKKLERLSAPIERDTFDDTAPGLFDEERDCLDGCGKPRVRPSSFCAEHDAEFGARMRAWITAKPRFPGHPNGGPAVTA
jgi:hypothetical protein